MLKIALIQMKKIFAPYYDEQMNVMLKGKQLIFLCSISHAH